jgi:hypothetical protein
MKQVNQYVSGELQRPGNQGQCAGARSTQWPSRGISGRKSARPRRPAQVVETKRRPVGAMSARSTSSAMRLEMAWRRDVARMKTNLMESAGCKSTSGLARGTFRTGERTFQCKRSMQVSPLPAQ